MIKIRHFADFKQVIIKITHFADFKQVIIKISQFTDIEQVITKISHQQTSLGRNWMPRHFFVEATALCHWHSTEGSQTCEGLHQL